MPPTHPHADSNADDARIEDRSADPAASLASLITAARLVVTRCAEMVDLLSDEAFAAPSTRFPGSAIGQHLRHTLDHFSLLLAGHAEGMPVRYDHRRRGVPIERDRAAAAEAIDGVRRAVESLTDAELRRRVTLRVMPDASGVEVDLESTLGRELAFATHHALHHVAMMKSIACEHGVALPDDYAKAPSTLAHERTRA